jgi:hypothetical protein
MKKLYFAWSGKNKDLQFLLKLYGSKKHKNNGSRLKKTT